VRGLSSAHSVELFRRARFAPVRGEIRMRRFGDKSGGGCGRRDLADESGRMWWEFPDAAGM